MAKVLISLREKGLKLDGKPFVAIYGTYSVDDKLNYTFGAYKIPSYNIASIIEGTLPDNPRIQNLLILD